MTKTQLMIYIVFISLEIMGISTFVELYKKQIRKGNSKIWENKLIGFLLSAAATAMLVVLNIFHPILEQIGANKLADYAFYTICFYFLQLKADMIIIKKLINTCLKTLLISKGFDEKEVEKILNASNSSEQ